MLKLWKYLLDENNDGDGGGGASTGGAGSSGGSGGDSGAASAGAGSGGGDASAAQPWLDPKTLTFKDGWQNELPAEFDELKPTFANFKDFKTLGKSLKDSMTAARAKTEGMIRLPVEPGKDAKPEDVEKYQADLAAYRKAVGIPDGPDGYKVALPEKLPEGVTVRDEHLKEFSALAHKIGLTPAQAQALSDFQLSLTARGHQEFSAGMEKFNADQQAALREAFGDKLEERVMAAKRVGMTFANNPDGPQTPAEMVQFMARIADAISEDKLAGANVVTSHLSPEVQAKELMRQPEYTDMAHPRHKETVARVNDLMRKAYPDRK